MQGLARWAPGFVAGYDGWGRGHMDWAPGAWLWMAAAMTFWIALIGLVVWLIVRGTRSAPPSPHDRAREILGERYARGELTTEEYRERLRELT